MPPDPYNDVLRSSYGLWENTGWVIDTQGDLREDVQYVTEGAQPRAYIRRGGKISFVLASVDTTSSTLDTLRRLDMELVGEGAQHPDAVSFLEKGYMQNFYFPHCGTTGVTGVRGYNRILYPQVYAGIDMWVYSGARGQKMMFVIAPGASPEAVQMQFTGQDQMDVDVNGWLRMQVDNKWFALPEAVAYQYDQNNVITPVTWGPTYLPNTNNGVVGFNFDAYDPTKPLVLLIGPPPGGGGGAYDESGLCWSTYYGGNEEDFIWDSAQGQGNGLFVCGTTWSDPSTFPFSPNMETFGGNGLCFLSGFNSEDQIQWKTFFGGEAFSEINPMSCVVQTSAVDHLVIGGQVTGFDMPLQQSGPAHYSPEPSSSFLAGFHCTSGVKYWSTYFKAGNVMELAVTPANRIFLLGQGFYDSLDTDPPNGSTSWPSTGSFGYIAMLDAQDRLAWFTHLPSSGTGYTRDGCIAAQTGKVVAVFSTDISTCQMVPGSQNQLPYTGGLDNVIYEFTDNGTALWSSYFGGPNDEREIQLDPHNRVTIDPASGDIVIMGATTGTLPMVNGGGWNDPNPDNAPPYNNGYAARFDGTTHALEWSTYLNSNDNVSTGNIKGCFGADGVLYITGTTTGHGIPFVDGGGYYHEENVMVNITNGLADDDAFVMAINPQFELIWSTLFGGIGGDIEETPYSIIERNGTGVIYVAGNTSKTENQQATYFPIDDGGGGPSTWWEYFGGMTDGFIASFCSEFITGIDDAVQDSNHLNVSTMDGSTLFVNGMRQGRVPYRVLGIDGRLIATGTLVAEGPQATIQLNRPIGSGGYVFDCAAQRALFVVP